MPVFLEYLSTFFEERNSRNGQDREKAQAATPGGFQRKGWGRKAGNLLLRAGLRERCGRSEHPHLRAELEAEKPVLQITWQPGAGEGGEQPPQNINTTEPACAEGLLCARFLSELNLILTITKFGRGFYFLSREDKVRLNGTGKHWTKNPIYVALGDSLPKLPHCKMR